MDGYPGLDAETSHGFAHRNATPDSDDEMPPLLDAAILGNNDLWLCAHCHSPGWRWNNDRWMCSACGSDSFYNANAKSSRSSFSSRPSYPGATSASDAESRNHGKAKVKFPGDPGKSAASSEFAESEAPTSDVTVNPENMEPVKPLSRRQRRAARVSSGLSHGAQPRYSVHESPKAPGSYKDVASPKDVERVKDLRPAAHFPVSSRDGHSLHSSAPPADGRPRRPSDAWRDDMLKNLTTAMTKDKDSDWNNKKGPQPGVKFRGGSPPSPPAWNYSKDDLRSFQKWERKLQVWRIQISSYLPPNEAAMLLYGSLREEAEEELEYASIDAINNDNGIDFILESLRKPLMTRSIYLKRRFLHDYENIQRAPAETIKSYCNRYHRSERSLESIGIQVSGMYDSEARGARLLDRMRVSLEQQRLILIGSGQSLHYDDIKEAAMLQFPDHRPTPMVTFAKEFDSRQDRVDRPSNNNYQNRTPFNKGKGNQKGKGKDKGRGAPSGGSRAYVTENAEEDQQDASPSQQDEDEDQTGEHEAEENEHDENVSYEDESYDNEDDGISEALAAAAECLTVTARRLQGVTLGRKFSGAPKSIEERKQQTHCAVCGEKGHWQGDEACSFSKQGKGSSFGGRKPNAKGKGNGKPSNKDKPSDVKSKKVLSVIHHDGSTRNHELHEPHPQPQHDSVGSRSVTFQDDQAYGCYFTYMIRSPSKTNAMNKVYGTNMQALCQYIVLDTACQKSCCSSRWMEQHDQLLGNYHLCTKYQEMHEPFEFGHGPTQYSDFHVYIPSCFNFTSRSTCLLGAFVIPNTNDIPFVGSNPLLRKLAVILDLPQQKARLGSLDCEVDIHMVNGHIALKIDCFPKYVNKMSVWHELSTQCDQPNADLELILPPQPSKQSPTLGGQSTVSDACRSATTSMAGEMAQSHESNSIRRAPNSLHADDSRASWPASTPVDCPPRSDGHGDADSPDETIRSSMSTHTDPKVRQSSRQVRQVHRLRHEVGMGRGTRKVGFQDLAKVALSTIAILLNSGDLHGPQSKTNMELRSNHIDLVNYANGELFGTSTSTTDSKPFFQEDQEEGVSPKQRSFQTSQEGCGTSGGGFGRRGHGAVQLGARQSLKSKTWLIGHLRAQQRLYTNEVEAYQALATFADIKRSGVKIDLMELFAGRARVTYMANKYGLSALQPIDQNVGINLDTNEGKMFTIHALQQFKPLLLLVAWPCTWWSLMNENCNYSYRLDELEQFRQQQRPMVRFTTNLCLKQIEENRLFLGENVLRSRIWKEEPILELTQHPDCQTTVCDAGAYGAEDLDGYPVIKPHRWVTNSPDIAEELKLRMTEEQKKFAKPIEGKNTGPSGEYCPGLANAILRGLQKEARKRNPTRFCIHNQVLFMRPARDEKAWNSILDELESRFENTAKRPYNLSSSDELYEGICKLVPWEMSRIQVVWCPGARRWPEDVPFKHRGAVLRTTEGQLVIESEDLSSTSYPKQRYTMTMRLGIFFFGNAPEDEKSDQQPQQADPLGTSSTMPLPGFKTEIWFENAPPSLTSSMRSSLARLHVNMGHASLEELVRILAASNNLTSNIIIGLDALRCGSCIRLKQPKPPPTASTAPASQAGFFGENLESDIVYMRLLTGEAVPVVGIICSFTNYQCAKVLTDRSAEQMLKTFIEIWYRPLGLPLRVSVDPDTAYLSVMQEWHNQHGIDYTVIPAEEHWKIGKVEKRNALLRSICEKMIDEFGVGTKQQLDEVLVAALYALNSATYTHGRSPYQIVFGRVPRPLGDLLADPSSLIISKNLDQQLLQPELLRAHAVSNLMQLTASQGVKRAILRKTRTQQEITNILPGQPVAFWRWSTRARQHKRGAWCLGRFLGLDPDKKSCWIQVGKTSLRVGRNQIRLAVGWEAWSPSQEDIEILKNAEANLSQDLWEDAVEQPPPAIEDINIDHAQPTSMQEHPPLQDQPTDNQNNDHWQITNATATRYHIQPRTYLYTPIQEECNFDINLLSPTRQTQLDPPFDQTPFQDNWHETGTALVSDQQWTGTTTFYWNDPHSIHHQQLDLPIDQLTSPSQHEQQIPAPNITTGAQEQQTSTYQQRIDTTNIRQQIQQSQQQYNVDNRNITINIDSPTYQQYQQFGPTTAYGPVPPTSRSRARSRTPSKANSAPQTPRAQNAPQTPRIKDTPQIQGPEQRPAPAIQDTHPTSQPTQPDIQHADLTTAQEATTSGMETLPQLPAKRSAAEALIIYDVNAYDEIEPKMTYWDGSPETNTPTRSQAFYQAYLNSSQRRNEMGDIPEPHREDNSSSDEDLSLSNNRNMTRQEAKQLDREMPWREVNSLPTMLRDKFIKSAVDEYNGWMSWGGLQPLSQREADRVLKDPILKRRVMRSRAAYRDKSRGTGPLRAKTRVVIIGCMDPDLKRLSRNSPTPTRLSEFILLAIATSGKNLQFNQDGLEWLMWLGDVEKAFLQGEQDLSERGEQPLYVLPPNDPILLAAQAFSAPLYQLTGNGYGLANAPRVWYKRVLKRMLQNNFFLHSLDRCFFVHYADSGRPDCFVIVHVDDFMAVHSTEFNMKILEDMFSWGKTGHVTTESPGEYRGKEIKLIKENGKFMYRVTQTGFIKHMEGGQLPPGRLQKDPKLSTSEMQDFRSICGSLQWLSGQSSPDVSAVASLCHRGKDTDITDLKKLLDATNNVKKTPEDGITFPAIPFNKQSVIVAVSDSSWANALNFSCQYGVLIMICPAQAKDTTTYGMMVDWKSGRSTRVCRSTLAAEASAADEATDRATYLNAFLTELFTNEPAYKAKCIMDQIQVTDAKSLYDCLVSENPVTTDKRSLINIRSVQQHVEPKNVHWVPTRLMHADGLTKLDKTLQENLRVWCMKPWCQLRDDNSVQSAKQRPV